MSGAMRKVRLYAADYLELGWEEESPAVRHYPEIARFQSGEETWLHKYRLILYREL